MIGRCLLLLVAVVGLGAVDVTFRDRDVVFDVPEDGEVHAVLVWFHAAGAEVDVDAGWWHDRGLVERGLAIACPPERLRGWSDQDRLFARRLCKQLRERFDLEPRHVVVGGIGDGAVFAQGLATTYQDALCGGALLVRSADGGQWRAADDDPPMLALVANANDPHVPVASLRRVERRLAEDGYPTRFAVGSAGTGMDLTVARSLVALLETRGTALAEGAIRPLLDPDEVPQPEPEPDSEAE